MRNISAKYIGLITGAIMVIAALLLFYGMTLPPIGTSRFVVWGIYIAGIIWSMLAFKNQSGNHVFKAYFSEGFKAFIVAALIMIVYTFIFYKLNPQLAEATINENNILALKEGNHTPAEVQENAAQFRKIFMPVMLMSNTFIYLVIGALVSVIFAGLLSQQKNN